MTPSPTFMLGDITVTAIEEFIFQIPLGTLFPGADPERLDDCGWPGTLSGGNVNLAVRAWLIQANGRNILVDACVGADKERPGWAAWHRRDGAAWHAALARAGVSTADIDVVFCTHLHADHVGWNTRLENGRWVPTFTNARTLVGRTEYAHFEALAAADRHGAFGDSVAPVMEPGLMDLVDEGHDIDHGLSLTMTPGHSPGHMCLNAPGAVFCGDVIHSPVQLADPQLACAFDHDKDAARSARRTLLDSIAEAGSLLVPAHFLDPGRCRLTRDGDAFRATVAVAGAL